MTSPIRRSLSWYRNSGCRKNEPSSTEYIYLQRNQRILRKINFKGTNLDIELFNSDSDSYFDRYLNEVLYLLDHVDADVVVFEDIDRYDKNLIFERLRESNTLANHIREQGTSDAVGKEKKPLRFCT